MLGALMYFMLWFPLQFAQRFWWRWHVEGLENLPPPGQGGILAINHIDWTDVHILGASLPLSRRPWWIAKVEMFLNPIIAWSLVQLRAIPIKRGKRDLGALNAAEDVLNQGKLLVIFPEGHRSRTGGLLEGRGGAIRLAVRTGCPIIPVSVWGTENGLWGAVRRKPIHLRIGAPYHPDIQGDTIPWDRMTELTDEMMLHIAALMPEQYWGYYQERMLQAG